MLEIVQKAQNGNLKGNTKHQIPASKYWCFTLHSEPLKEITDQLEQVFNMSCNFYIFSYENGKSGKTPHYQGYIETFEKIRPTELKLSKCIHWEKCAIRKHNLRREYNVRYITKEFGFIWKEIIKHLKINIYYKEALEDELIKLLKKIWPYNPKLDIKVLNQDSLYRWQIELLSVLDEDPDDRLIHWYWSDKGNIGKSTFCKYLVIKKNALILSGNATDMKYAIQQYIEKTGNYPEIICLDIARDTNINKLSYSGFEEVKNGLFFSGKYESGMVVGNPPHFVVFANKEPSYQKMSLDRWKVYSLD